MIPDMSEALIDWSTPITRIIKTRTTVDRKKTYTESYSEIEAVIQPADTEKLKSHNIDYSLEYILIHTSDTLLINDCVKDIDGYTGLTFKIIRGRNYSRYGFFEMIGEQVK